MACRPSSVRVLRTVRSQGGPPETRGDLAPQRLGRARSGRPSNKRMRRVLCLPTRIAASASASGAAVAGAEVVCKQSAKQKPKAKDTPARTSQASAKQRTPSRVWQSNNNVLAPSAPVSPPACLLACPASYQSLPSSSPSPSSPLHRIESFPLRHSRIIALRLRAAPSLNYRLVL